MGLRQVPWMREEVGEAWPHLQSPQEMALFQQGQLWVSSTGLARSRWAREGAGLSSASHM